MGRNRHKVAFIICVNDEAFFKEASLYINQLALPYGFTTEIVPVYGAKSMAAGYNIGMTRTDAKYKVYMHQDVFITNPNFLNDVLMVFKLNWKIGMIGMVGTVNMPASGVSWHSEKVGNLYLFDSENCDYSNYAFRRDDGLTDVQCIDGFLMVTKEDIPWREDLFDGWDYYDVSQSYEFRRRGYRVVVPEQKKPWVAHEDGEVINLWNYNRYRQIFMNEYMQG